MDPDGDEGCVGFSASADVFSEALFAADDIVDPSEPPPQGFPSSSMFLVAHPVTRTMQRGSFGLITRVHLTKLTLRFEQSFPTKNNDGLVGSRGVLHMRDIRPQQQCGCNIERLLGLHVAACPLMVSSASSLLPCLHCHSNTCDRIPPQRGRQQ